jgi:hypothetical protein
MAPELYRHHATSRTRRVAPAHDVRLPAVVQPALRVLPHRFEESVPGGLPAGSAAAGLGDDQRLVHHPAEQLLHVAAAQQQAIVEPDRVADDLTGETRPLIERRRMLHGLDKLTGYGGGAGVL